MNLEKNVKSASTRNAVETAIDISRIHEGTWARNARKYLSHIASYVEIVRGDYK
ncbi:MAG: hypothetical protein WC584_03170 [Candidatus Pacearchaeota archaeon]